MPNSLNYYNLNTNTLPIPNKRTRKVKIFFLSFLITILLISLVVSCGFLYYIVNNKDNALLQALAVNSPNTSVSPTSIETQTCKDDREYSNQIIPDEDVTLYPRGDFYLEKGFTTNGQKFSKNEVFLTDTLIWSDADKDALIHSGKSIVCIKGKNKIGSIEFKTNTVKFLNPVRYKDPEKSLNKVLIQAFYMIPNGAIVQKNWKQNIENNLSNVQEAQKRIFDNKSQIDYRVYPDPVIANDISRDLLTQIAQGIVTKDKNAQQNGYLKPVDHLNNAVYIQNIKSLYPSFFENADSNYYNQVTSVVYFEVGNSSQNSSVNRRLESGYAFLSPVLDNGNYFGIIGVNLSRNISTESAVYHEFMHTLGLPDEYAYTDGSLQRKPTHLFKGISQSASTLMEQPEDLDLSHTYIDDQERVLMGIRDK